MRNFLVLLGSGEYTPALNGIDQYVVGVARERGFRGPVVLVPIAAGQEANFLDWNDRGAEHFTSLAINAVGVTAGIQDELETDENLELIDQASVVYFSGGRPDYLYTQLAGTRFLERLRKRFKEGMPVVASSAGAMVMGSYYLANPYEISEKHQDPLWKVGLGFTSYVIIPHYNHEDAEYSSSTELPKIIKSAPVYIRKDLIGIDEDTALCIEKGRDEIVKGKGEVHRML